MMSPNHSGAPVKKNRPKIFQSSLRRLFCKSRLGVDLPTSLTIATNHCEAVFRGRSVDVTPLHACSNGDSRYD